MRVCLLWSGKKCYDHLKRCLVRALQSPVCVLSFRYNDVMLMFVNSLLLLEIIRDELLPLNLSVNCMNYFIKTTHTPDSRVFYLNYIVICIWLKHRNWNQSGACLAEGRCFYFKPLKHCFTDKSLKSAFLFSPAESILCRTNFHCGYVHMQVFWGKSAHLMD